MTQGFREEYSYESRKSESDKIVKKYPNRVPIIVERADHCNLGAIDKKKYLVPNDLTMNQFIYVIRKRIDLKAHESIFLLVDNQVCPSNRTCKSIYEERGDDDGFLYIIYSSENTFG
jgi:GABA(A) receptor-associated protein